MTVAASFFMLREIEAALALDSHVTIDPDQRGASWRLPVSKCDPSAVGCTRHWRCICEGDARRPCPACALVEQKQSNRERSALLGIPLHSLPLFPNAAGMVVSKRLVISSLEALVVRAGGCITTAGGTLPLGGHSFRVAGAQLLAGRE